MSSASRHKLPTLAAAELHAKLVEHIQKGPKYQWRAYIATVVRYHVRPQWPILGQGKESRNLRKAEKRSDDADAYEAIIVV